MGSLILAICALAIFSWLAAGVWLGEQIVPRWHRPLVEAERLNAWLQEWQLGLSQGKALAQKEAIPQFKFFGELAVQALTHARSYGSFPREVIWEWREGINREVQFEKKWRGIRHGGYLQFTLFAGITWAFIFLTSDTLTTPLPYELLLAVGTLQLIGLVMYWPLMKLLAHRRLAGMGMILESLYTLRSLGRAGLPSQQVLQQARVSDLTGLQNPMLKTLKTRLIEVARLYQQQGVPLASEVQLLLQEAWFIREEALGKLIKLADQVRLAILIIWFGGAYFLFLIGLIQQLLQSQ